MPDKAQFAGVARVRIRKDVPYAHSLMIGAHILAEDLLAPGQLSQRALLADVAFGLYFLHQRPFKDAHAVQAGVMAHGTAVLRPSRTPLAVGVAFLELVVDEAFHALGARHGYPLHGFRRVDLRQSLLIGVCLQLLHGQHVRHNSARA